MKRFAHALRSWRARRACHSLHARAQGCGGPRLAVPLRRAAPAQPSGQSPTRTPCQQRLHAPAELTRRTFSSRISTASFSSPSSAVLDVIVAPNALEPLAAAETRLHAAASHRQQQNALCERQDGWMSARSPDRTARLAGAS
jgi:hypothetical protein